jgi:hypothetical protein
VLKSSTTLPAGLAVDTLYYIRDATANTFKLAATSGGDAIDITGTGTGTHTCYTPGTYTGTFRDTYGYESSLFFFFGTSDLGQAMLQWSDDGSTDRSGLVSTSNILPSTLTSGFYVGIGVQTTMVDRYVRVELINGSTDQTTFEVDYWLYQGSYPGSYGGLSSALTSLSSALLTRSVLAGTKPDGTFTNVSLNPAGALQTSSFSTEVALGNVTGYESSTRFGRVKALDAADSAVDIWAFGDDGLSPRTNTKTFPAAADTIYLTSSSAGDTAVTMTVEYITSTGAAATVTGVTLTGQTPVSIGATGLDVNRLYVDGSTAAVGKIYASVGNDFTGGAPNDTADVLAFAPIGYNQGQLSHFTVPLAQTLLMGDVLLMVSRANGSAGSADVTLRIKEFGGTSRVRREWFPTSATPITNGVQNIVIPARAQILWRVDDVSDTDTQVSVSWSYTLVDD